MTDAPATATHLRCEYLENPLAIDATAPRLSWEMASASPGAAQGAYRVIAAGSREALRRNSVVNGATTIWERWNGWTKEDGPGDVNMNSYSHYAYGAVVEWMFDTIAGIDHRGSGFQHFTLRPQPGGSLKHAAATYRSPYGTIHSAWRKRGSQMRYEATIPANTSATVALSVPNLATVRLDGKPLARRGIIPQADGSFVLPAGEYVMTWRG